MTMEIGITKAMVRDYVELFAQLRGRVESEDVALVILQELGKDSRVERMRTGNGVKANGNGAFRDSGVGNGEQPATERQLAFLRDLGMNPPAGLTKGSASALIDEARGQR